MRLARGNLRVKDINSTHRHPGAVCPKVDRPAASLLKDGVGSNEGGALGEDASGKDGGGVLHLDQLECWVVAS